MGTSTMTQEDQPLVLERQVNVTYELKGKEFECLEVNGIPTALENTQAHGHAATMPELTRWRTNNQDSRLWHNWYTALSEEDIGPNPKRIKLNTTDPVYALAHGNAAILSKPTRIRKALTKKNGLTKQYAAHFSEEELNLVLSGHDGQFPVFTFDELVEATQSPTFHRETPDYVVVSPLAQMENTQSGYQKIDGLRNNPLVIARTEGEEQANAFLDKAGEVYNTKKLGNWHPFKNVDSKERQGRLLFLGYCDYYGLSGNYNLSSSGRFVRVAPEALDAREKRVVTPTLEQVLALGQTHVSKTAQKAFEKAVRSLYH